MQGESHVTSSGSQYGNERQAHFGAINGCKISSFQPHSDLASSATPRVARNAAETVESDPVR